MLRKAEMNHSNIVIGIDPGASGGMAVFYPDGKAFAVGYKKEKTYAHQLKEIAEQARIENWSISAYVELLTGFQGFGKYQLTGKQGFAMGTSYGKIGGALEALEIPHWYVSSMKWEKTIPGSGKERLYIVAKQRFPQLKPTKQTCDAILIAEWGMNYGSKTVSD